MADSPERIFIDRLVFTEEPHPDDETFGVNDELLVVHCEEHFDESGKKIYRELALRIPSNIILGDK